ncbi:hypothetical protein DH2020_005730 [Rehmannia glutinosa]|uniref:Pentatricopeptide repeat-containing protein n=1 Tax=Rehmannia glutinosa TaxID=99300 RepID=A0ABR0XHH9_REHGL
MNLHLCCRSSSPLPPLPIHYLPKHSHFCFLLPAKSIHPASFSGNPISKNFAAAAQKSAEEGKLASELLDDELLGRVSAAKDAAEVLSLIAEERRSGGVVSASDCRLIISAALDRGNAELALSVFAAMRSSFDSGWVENSMSAEKWKWSRPDVHTYTLLVKGLAASLRVSDALRMLDCVCRVGVSPGEEVPFGKVVRCPSCMIAVAVAQPQQGIQACAHNFTLWYISFKLSELLQNEISWLQLVSCSKCRYQYELVSGNILTIESEEISMDVPAWKRGLQFLQIMKLNIPAAVHSIVVETPPGMARTHRFATETVDLPAQEGERVTVAVAAPLSVYRELGPLKFSPRVPNFYPGEPMCLTNHRDGRESRLLRPPSKDVGKSILSPSILFPILAVFATGDAASGIVDPSLPQLIAVAVVSSLAVGVTFNSLVLPQLNKAGLFAKLVQLPQRSVDITSIRQQLLSQYDVLQSRIKELKKAAENEVWMLARMWQLENKICAVGEPSYRARRNRVKRVREGLESSLENRIELIESYARVRYRCEKSMNSKYEKIVARISLDIDVSKIHAKILPNRLSKSWKLRILKRHVIVYSAKLQFSPLGIGKWRLQAEANDEAERLLSSDPVLSEQGF